MPSVWLSLLPLLSVAFAGLIVFIAGAGCKGRPAGLFMAMSFLAVATSGFSTILIPAPPGPLFNMLVMDGFARYYLVVVAIIAGLTLLFSYEYAKIRKFAGDEFFGLILFATLGMMLIVCASHWLLFLLGLELLSLCFYVLIAIRRDDALAGEAALKYFIMGAVASGFVVFGIAMLYAATGSLELSVGNGPGAWAEDRLLIRLALGLVLVGLGFKLSLVPFHLWAPDVYQGAPAPVAAFLATGAKVAVFAFFLRLTEQLAPAAGAAFFPVLWTMAALTMVIGNVTALVQERVKRLLAYSSIGHMGYLLMALLAVGQGGSQAVMFYSAVYAVMDLGAFGVIGMLSEAGKDRDELAEYSGLGFLYPWRSGLLALCLLALAGMPPTAGLIGKFMIFQAAIKTGVLMLAAIGILTAIVSVFFYLKVVMLLYTHPGPATSPLVPAGPSGTLACLAISALLLWLGILPAPVLTMINRIAGLLSLP